MCWSLGGMQLKLGSVPDHCFMFCWGEIFGPCDVALGGQLRDLGRCHFRLRLHSHMTSVVHDGNAQVDVMVWKKFHVTFMQQLTNVWSAGVYEICAVTDRWSLLTVTFGNPSVRPPWITSTSLSTQRWDSPQHTFIILFFHPMISIASCVLSVLGGWNKPDQRQCRCQLYLVIKLMKTTYGSTGI